MSSITLLPAIIDAHLNAINARNNDAIMSTFGRNAVVIDEGKQYRSLKEIREWSAEALVAHNASIDVQRSMQDDSSIVVHVVMEGSTAEAGYAINTATTLLSPAQLSSVVAGLPSLASFHHAII